MEQNNNVNENIMITETQYKEIIKLAEDILNGNEIIQDENFDRVLSNAYILEKHLIENVKNNKFKMLYQPKFVNKKETKGAEALFRTESDYPFYIRPDVAFTLFKIFEHESFVVQKQVEVVSKDLKSFKQLVSDDYCISINVAIDCLNENFVEKLEREIKKNGLSYKNFSIEILESENFDNLKARKDIIDYLHDKGVTFAIDDFGSINANETALNTINFDIIKIDNHYLKDARTINDYDKVKNLIKDLHKKYPKKNIVVEGVENEEDYQHLLETGVPQTFQGFHFEQPIEANKLTDKYKTSRPSQPGE